MTQKASVNKAVLRFLSSHACVSKYSAEGCVNVDNASSSSVLDDEFHPSAFSHTFLFVLINWSVAETFDIARKLKIITLVKER
jgi:hypothetical protein